jgi:hypothetical protein
MHSVVYFANIGQRSWTSNLGEGVEHLGGKIYKLLDYVQRPIFSEHLASLTQTVKSLLNLVRNAAMFFEDCSGPKPNSELLTYCLSITGLPPRR